MSMDKLVTAATRLTAACVGAAFLFAAAPSRAEDKPKPYIDIRIDGVLPGSIKTFRWNGRPFVIVRATNEMLGDLRAQTPHTWSERVISDDGPAFFVFSALSSARGGCPVVHAPIGAARYAPERLWQGGFYDPCRFGEWDYAGRTIKQYVDQDEAMRRPDLGVLTFELKDHTTLRITR